MGPEETAKVNVKSHDVYLRQTELRLTNQLEYLRKTRELEMLRYDIQIQMYEDQLNSVSRQLKQMDDYIKGVGSNE